MASHPSDTPLVPGADDGVGTGWTGAGRSGVRGAGLAGFAGERCADGPGAGRADDLGAGRAGAGGAGVAARADSANGLRSVVNSGTCAADVTDAVALEDGSSGTPRIAQKSLRFWRLVATNGCSGGKAAAAIA